MNSPAPGRTASLTTAVVRPFMAFGNDIDEYEVSCDRNRRALLIACATSKPVIYFDLELRKPRAGLVETLSRRGIDVDVQGVLSKRRRIGGVTIL